VQGFADQIAVERKSLADLFGTLGQGRERFERELVRLSAHQYAAVVDRSRLG
jgi:ERCC4-type nuclease